jgi:hypothetical protein
MGSQEGAAKDNRGVLTHRHDGTVLLKAMPVPKLANNAYQRQASGKSREYNAKVNRIGVEVSIDAD